MLASFLIESVLLSLLGGVLGATASGIPYRARQSIQVGSDGCHPG